MKRTCIAIAAVLAAAVPGFGAPRSTLYGPDPDALWNRVHAAIWMRTAPDGKHYAEDTLDPPLVGSTRMPLKGVTYAEILKALDAFNGQTAEEVAEVAPLKRALIQRELWAVFDWTARIRWDVGREEAALLPALHALQQRLAVAIRRVALSGEEIAALPDPYSLTVEAETYDREPEKEPDRNAYLPTPPYLPAGLDTEGGAWVFIDPGSGLSDGPLHFTRFAPRSVFYVAVRTPEGSAHAADYLNELNSFHPAWVPTEDRSPAGPTLPNSGIHRAGVIPNPATPQFPGGTQWALVRKAMLIDSDGKITASPLVESIQLRTYLKVEKEDWTRGRNQVMAEFLLSPRALLAGETPLVAQQGDEIRFRGFLHHEFHDRFEESEEQWAEFINHEREPGLNCFGCHSGWGIHGVNSRASLFRSQVPVMPPSLQPRSMSSINGNAIGNKVRRYDWGLLEGLWRCVNWKRGQPPPAIPTTAG